MTPEERSRRASIASNTRWARTPDRRGATSRARRAWEARFEREVDPNNELDPETRAKLAANARKAFYQRFSQKGVQARRKKAA